ncbi:3-deoxy-D-manno-octulosonic acid transferase [Rhodobacter sp. KR11]|uniref:3-deoxy-D-manno-octulosonic acid transferase n=1 Tax=Rhodobacter sp. KR11 TaxID=2974588 RepID=UPI002223D794|nr:glycosyltransferase N-terminal domain-containing protein [Rhodobacter sp. KR11]MCW1920069.1 3-deoxy-D-manno-octulosonic acid transferase [Rhodobacter sp. KR11]
MTLPFRLLFWLLPRLMLGLALWRLLRRETLRDLNQRLGGSPAAGAIWVHGASNGELASARWVIEALAAQGPVLVTASTVTGRDMVAGWGLPGVRVSLAPLDLGLALRRFLRQPPCALINLEAEFWPHRFTMLRARGLPFALIGARMSERSARFWGRAGLGFLQGAALVSAQDSQTAERLAALGLAPGPVFDLKAAATARLPQPTWAPRGQRARVLLAASTHAGEEALILDALAPPFDLLILAPRHPRRGDAVAKLIAARGLTFGRRSRGEMPAVAQSSAPQTTGPRVFLADTMGEMDLWYAMAGACFVGGSLVDKRGHTPWEPARHGAAILHGPHVANFQAAYATLQAKGAALPWSPAALTALDGATQDRMAQAAAACLAQSGDGTALIAALLSLIARK